ncbi:MAG: arginine--tRNA ligase [Candidatus Omnitrophica bacterium]|nr:arginine--tRNA ligase [Candidatus Omnitrophota bacterium]
MLKKLKKDLIVSINKSILSSFPSLKDRPLRVHLDIPKDRNNGHLSTNAAFQISSLVEESPLKTAELICESLSARLKKSKLQNRIMKVEVRKPGFINFFYTRNFLYRLLRVIADSPNKFISSNSGKGMKVQIEFVSANPTGLLSIAHGRQAAVGDAIAGILNFHGYKVTREYFINDEGNQIDALGKSVMARYLELQGKEASLPEDGYEGAYIIDIARKFTNKFNKNSLDKKKLNTLKIVSMFSVKRIMDEIKEDLEALGVHMDVWFSQKKLSRADKIGQVIKELKKKGLIYKKDNALWFKSTRFGDDKDRVIRKSSGEYTYLAPDIAYHKNKLERKFGKVINIWGPDHHGYIARLQAAVSALGAPEGFLEILIIQLATLYKNGRPVSMSTRKGQYITLKELTQEVGKDVARFFFLMRKRSSHLDFDLELAKKRSMDNPVYYIQYAYARISGIIELEKKEAKKLPRCKYALLDKPEELNLIMTLIEFPAVLESSAASFEPYYLTVYLRQLADAFHSFYQKNRVLSDDLAMTAVRLKLIKAVRNVLHKGLNLLGVSSPVKM